METGKADRFESVTVLLPVINETSSLIETVEVIVRDADKDVKEFIALICSKTTPESRGVLKKLQQQIGGRFSIHEQVLPSLGGALREGIDLATASHVLVMSTDLETNPEVVKDMIAAAKVSPSAIISASRWMKGGGFEKGYGLLRMAVNYAFQKSFALLYQTNMSDMSHGYRLYPTKLMKSIRWEELRHTFLLETLVKPLRLGVRVIEIPEMWRPRIEGRPQSTLLFAADYVRVGLRVRFRSKEKIMKNGR